MSVTSSMPVPIAHIAFPELSLHPSAGHKLRGYFGSFFREHSLLLHNHLADGSLRYRYPLVQYKVIDKVPCLVGLGEGADLLAGLFIKVRELKLDDQVIPVHTKNIESRQWQPEVCQDLHTYSFKTLWMALNQQNYREYLQEDESRKQEHLKRILIGNILSFLKGMDIYLDPGQRLLAQLSVYPSKTRFKDQPMFAFSGRFTTNILLPDYIGLGKSVSRGYGVIERLPL